MSPYRVPFHITLWKANKLYDLIVLQESAYAMAAVNAAHRNELHKTLTLTMP